MEVWPAFGWPAGSEVDVEVGVGLDFMLGEDVVGFFEGRRGWVIF